MENWKPMAGYEGWYEISDEGRIRNILQIKRRHFKKILTSYPTGHGYYETTVCFLGKRKRVRIHTEVAKTFIGPRPPGMQINHKDLSKSNNSLSNLEYVTPQQNVRHYHDTKGSSRIKIENGEFFIFCPKCKIWKTSLFFRKHIRFKFQSYCKLCSNQINYLYRKKLKLGSV